MSKKEQIFYVYLDRTGKIEVESGLDLTKSERVFYVGKGKEKRLTCVKRNVRWHRIDNKYGHIREVILATKDEQFAFEMEMELIKLYKTFEAAWPKGEGWGANFTAGGEGPSGRVGKLSARWGKFHTEETKLKMSGENNHNFGKPGFFLGHKHTEESNKKNAEKHTGKKHTEESKKKVSDANKGHIVSEETRKKISDAHTGVPMSPEATKKIGEVRRARSPLDEIKVIEIREKYATGKYSYNDLSVIYGVGSGGIADVIKRNTWNHMPTTINPPIKWMRSNGNTYAATLNEEKVIEIREKFSTGRYFQRDLAAEYGVTRGTIGSIVNNVTWKNVERKV